MSLTLVLAGLSVAAVCAAGVCVGLTSCLRRQGARVAAQEMASYALACLTIAVALMLAAGMAHP